MNQSYFIKTLKNDHKLDFNELWEKTIADKNDKDASRASSDEAERKFWEGHSEKYDDIPSLYDYAPFILDKLVDIIGKDKNVIEIGCGTGKFTIPMARLSKNVLGLDFSKHMLQKTKHKLIEGGTQNVVLKQGKFEEVSLNPVDGIYAVNANYRMVNIEANINKMRELAKEKVVFVWTMQRSIYDEILNQTRVKGIGRGQEYIQLINILYNMGIDPCMEIIPVTKHVVIGDVNSHYKEIDGICSEHGISPDAVKKAFDSRLTTKGDELIYKCLLKVAIIHFDGLGA